VVVLVSLLAVAAGACGSPTPSRRASEAAGEQAIDGSLGRSQALFAVDTRDPHAHLSSGVSLIPLEVHLFVFGPDDPAVTVQPTSLALVDLVPKSGRLHLLPLPSPRGTAAVNLLEDSTPRLKWGSLMTPAQRTIFRAFAADPSMGNWLVITDDVNVKGGPDPIPLTAYIWPRSDVVSYWRCGIPSTGIDACTSAFYERADMLLIFQGGTGHVR